MIFLKRSLLLVLFFYSSILFAQEKYWQQHVNYKIDVKLNDVTNELVAQLELIYTNNSPDTLSEIYFHLWPNAYKDRSTALTQQLLEDGNTRLYFATEQERGFIDGLTFKVDNELVEYKFDKKHIDIVKIKLLKPLLTGGKITITTPFRVKIPSSRFSRLGHKDQSYQITQWYPKPAVYDIKGWNVYPYLNQGEFYSEFGEFTVNITLPKNYVVAATGNLQNENEIKWLNNLSGKKLTKNTDSMVYEETSLEVKTLTYTQKNVHDFAWFASKDFNVRKEVFELPGTERKITAWAFFSNSESDLWKNATTYIKNGVIHYSKYVGHYPYDVVSAVHAPLSVGAGMEYPTITVIGNSGTASTLETVIVHEVGHNWFYGILGTNEREHAWMDEGINTYYEAAYFINRDKNPNDNSNENLISSVPIISKLLAVERLNYMEMYKYLYTIGGSSGLSQSANISGDKYSSVNYGLVVYMKVGALFYELKNYLGEDVYNKCMQSYYNKFKFKHPYPKDIQEVFENTSGKELDWFFVDVLNNNVDVDYKVKGIKKENGSAYLKIKNKSSLNVPFSITQYKKDNLVTEEFSFGFVGDTTVKITLVDGVDRIMIAKNGTIDINEKDNHIRTDGIFKKWNKVNFKFLGYPEKSDRSTLFYLPAFDYNYYDKLILGASFYNSFLQTKKLEYVITPMFAFGTNEFVGRAYANYNIILKSKRISSIVFESEIDYFNFSLSDYELEVGSKSAQYQKYLRVNPALVLNFRKKNYRSSVKQTIVLENKSIYQNKFNFDTIVGFYREQKVWNYLYNLTYSYNNGRALDPYNIIFSSEWSEKHAKLNASYTQSFTYGKTPGEFSFRIFTGAFLFDDYPETNVLNDYRFRLGGWRGKDDYAFDNSFFGRTELDGFWSQQTVLNDGAFKIPTFIGQNRDWLAALNLSASLPGLSFVGAFADFGTFENAGNIPPNEEPILYDAGFWFKLGNFLAVYFPVLKSDYIKKSLETNNINFGEQIRFELKVSKFRIQELRKNLFE